MQLQKQKTKSSSGQMISFPCGEILAKIREEGRIENIRAKKQFKQP